MSVTSQSAALDAGEAYASDLGAPLARVRHRLVFLAGLALLGILLLLTLSNVFHGQQRRADIRIAEMINIGAERNLATERLLRHLSYLEACSDGTRPHEPLTPTLQVDYPDARQTIIADVRRLRENFALLATDMSAREDFASQLREPLAEGRRQFDHAWAATPVER